VAEFPTIEELLAKIQNVSKQFVVLKGTFYGEQPFFEPECHSLEDFLKLTLACGQKCLYLEFDKFAQHDAVTEHLEDIEELEEQLEALLEMPGGEDAGEDGAANDGKTTLSDTDSARFKTYLASVTRMREKYDVDGASPDQSLALLDAIDTYTLTFIMGGVHHEFVLYNTAIEDKLFTEIDNDEPILREITDAIGPCKDKREGRGAPGQN